MLDESIQVVQIQNTRDLDKITYALILPLQGHYCLPPCGRILTVSAVSMATLIILPLSLENLPLGQIVTYLTLPAPCISESFIKIKLT